MKRVLLVSILVLPRVASADEAEVQLGVSPTLSIVSRGDATNTGFGGSVSGRWGLRDWFAVEGMMQAERFGTLKDPVFDYQGQDASLFYEMTRFSVVPSAVLRFGARAVISLAGGVGYRVEVRSGREVAREQVRLHVFDNAKAIHQLVTRVVVGGEYRFRERFSFGVQASSVGALLGGERELDLQVGLTGAFYFYP